MPQRTDGKLFHSFRAADIAFMHDGLPEWSLTLSREGYHDEVIDISPRRKPNAGNVPTQLAVVAYMRAKK